MKRVIVIGCPGAGKSTFARRLQEKTDLPLYYLDRIFHNADRTTVTREEFDTELMSILYRDQWIIDGNYQRTLSMRFEYCTDVFLLDYPLEECLEGAASRVGVKREDMPWIEEEFDPEFRQYIIDFPKDQLPGIYEKIEQYKDKRNIAIFNSREEANRWIADNL
jgi:adenylate kinase family enzyme